VRILPRPPLLVNADRRLLGFFDANGKIITSEPTRILRWFSPSFSCKGISLLPRSRPGAPGHQNEQKPLWEAGSPGPTPVLRPPQTLQTKKSFPFFPYHTNIFPLPAAFWSVSEGCPMENIIASPPSLGCPPLAQIIVASSTPFPCEFFHNVIERAMFKVALRGPTPPRFSNRALNWLFVFCPGYHHWFPCFPSPQGNPGGNF